MRDINRIDKITERLNYLWKLYPDFRLWQLIGLIVTNLHIAEHTVDPFYIEDDIWLRLIQTTINQTEKE